MNIFFDIETIPVQDADQIAGLVADMEAKRDQAKLEAKAPGNYKKPEAIEQYIADARAALDADHEAAVKQAIERTSFDGGLGQVVCIGWAVEDELAMSVNVADLSRAAEADMLRQFFAALLGAHRSTSGTRPCLIGHNSNAFDIPFMWRRAMVLGIRPPIWFPRDPKPWGDATFDTMTAWAGVKDRISMDRLCRVLGIPGKGDGPTGADVWPMVQAGRISEVADYCRDDVERTRAIWRRMNFVPLAA